MKGRGLIGFGVALEGSLFFSVLRPQPSLSPPDVKTGEEGEVGRAHWQCGLLLRFCCRSVGPVFSFFSTLWRFIYFF